MALNPWFPRNLRYIQYLACIPGQYKQVVAEAVQILNDQGGYFFAF
jgi:hypothetical protein